ncbi:monocarboxylate transporter 13-like [Lytechinus variegatus]|uniref:monocarboxylate transporter 13-like n=1 Tax=Lytechinus variegatus TaxID=7654 RepID=UPI001BB2CB4C|nr:monocarboxylate transporter 13-like [Lytechinus variegatus]
MPFANVDKEGESGLDKHLHWEKHRSVQLRKSRAGNDNITSMSSSASSMQSSESLSSRLSNLAASDEKLSNDNCLSVSDSSESLTAPEVRTNNRLTTSYARESSSDTVDLFLSLLPRLDSDGDSGQDLASPYLEGVVREEIVCEDSNIASRSNNKLEKMTMDQIYTSEEITSNGLPTSSSNLPASCSVTSSVHSTSWNQSSTSSADSLTDSPSDSLTHLSVLDKPLSRPTPSSHAVKSPWMLLLWCHLSQILAGGLLKSLAVFLDDILEEFDSSVAFMGWMFSLEAFFFGLTCPFASFATKKLGPRVVMMSGGLINGVGILMASLATNIITVGLGISAIAGTGSSMIYVAALVTVRRNFHTFYAIANGLTLAGVSVSLFTFPPIIRVLIDHYGWRGALFILSAISLNTMVTGALMKDDICNRKPRRPSDDIGESKAFVSKSSCTPSDRTHMEGNVTASLSKGKYKLQGASNGCTGVTFRTDDDLKISHRLDDKESKPTHHASGCPEVGLRSVYVDGKITTIPIQGNVNGHLGRRPSIRDKAVSFVIANITHGLLFVVACLWSLANTATMKYIVAAGVQRGLTSLQGAMLLSITGITQCICLFLNGIIISKRWMTPLQLYLLVFLLMSGAIFGIAVFEQYAVGLVCSALFGLGTGTIISLNLVVQRTLDPRAGTQAAGWLMFIEGVAGCIGGFFIGAVRDISGSYTLSFFVAGAITLVAASFVVIILVIRRVRRGH